MKGTPNRKNAERIAAAEASGMLPHEFLLAVTRGESISEHRPTFEERLEAAKAAAPYYAPKLASVEQSGKDGGPIRYEIVTGVPRDDDED